MRNRIYRTRFGVLSALATVLLVIMGSAATAMASELGQPVRFAQMRVIHTSFDTPAVDVYVGGKKMISNLEFKGISRMVAIPAGSQSVRVTLAGRADNVLETNLDLQGDKTYSVVALGRRADITTKLLEDDLSPLSAGKTRLRVVHTSPDTPAVDVAVKGGSVLFPNLGLGDVSNYLTLDATTVDVELRPAGTTNVALDVPNLKLEAGKVYSAYGVGSLKGTPPLSVLAVADSAGSSIANRVNEALPLAGAGDGLLLLGILAVLVIGASAVAGGMSLRLLDYGYSTLDHTLWGHRSPRTRLPSVIERWVIRILNFRS